MITCCTVHHPEESGAAQSNKNCWGYDRVGASPVIGNRVRQSRERVIAVEGNAGGGELVLDAASALRGRRMRRHATRDSIMLCVLSFCFPSCQRFAAAARTWKTTF